jgi:FAD/FMN-containing dehydrogenase
VLASGSIVMANACNNRDLFFAIRGGGGGTYGVVISTTVKAHPPTTVVAQTLAIAPFTDAQIPQFMEALAIIYAAYPDLNDAGFSGYGSWNVDNYAPVFANFTTGYQHALAIFGKSVSDAQTIFAPVASKLEQYNGTSLVVSISYLSFPSYTAYYAAFYAALPVGTVGALGSRFFDRVALTGSPANLKKMLNITAGGRGEFTINSVCLVGGGQVFKDANDPYSGVNPAWRTAYVHNIVARGFAPGSDALTQATVHNDITYNKVAAMRALAPNTGSYMNEADRLDPLYLQDFYGQNLLKLQAVKAKYDPQSVFYCPTCVGSDKWAEDNTGRLCSVVEQ